jgi:hypothetical protein
MRAKFLTLASATGLGLMALIGVQSTAQAEEGYRYRSFHFEHRDRDYNRGHRDHDRGDRYSNRDRGHRDRYSYNYSYRNHDRR